MSEYYSTRLMEEEMEKETLLKELNLMADDYILYKLEQMSTTELRNLFQEKLYMGEAEICRCVRVVMEGRDCRL